MSKEDVRKLFDQGAKLLREDQPEEALKVFRSALTSAFSEKGQALYNIAICHLRLGDEDSAIDAIRNAVSLQPWLVKEFLADEDFSSLHDSDVATQIQASGAIPAFKFYSLNTISWATMIGSCFAGAVLISRNYSKLNNGRAAFLSVLWGVLAIVLILLLFVDDVIFPLLEEWAPLVPLIQAAVVYGIAKLLQGEALSNHKQIGGQFYSFWRVTGVVLLMMPVVVGFSLLLFVVTAEQPEDIELRIVAPKVVKPVERFEIQLHVRNDAASEQTLEEIEIANQYLRGFTIVGSAPSFSSKIANQYSWPVLGSSPSCSWSEGYCSSISYYYGLPIPPGQEIIITLHVLGVLQGDYSGDFGVCINNINSCLYYPVVTTVGGAVVRR